jgi:hypothetical protein
LDRKVFGRCTPTSLSLVGKFESLPSSLHEPAEPGVGTLAVGVADLHTGVPAEPAEPAEPQPASLPPFAVHDLHKAHI